MKKILHVISSPRGGNSNSIKLAEAILEKLKVTDPDAYIKTRDLTKPPFPHLEESHLNAFFTSPQDHTDFDRAAISHSNEAIAEIQDADILVIGAPMYNFGISSMLKSWLDHIARAGVTFKYTSEGPVGLVSGKKVYLAIASGGVYSSGPYTAMDFLTPYLIHVLGFMGMIDIKVLRAEGFNIPGLKDSALVNAINSIEL